MTEDIGWAVVADAAPAPGTASVPATWFTQAEHAAPYIKIRLDPGAASAVQETVLLSVARRGASGTQVFVLPGTLGLSGNNERGCSVTPVTSTQYRSWLLKHAITTGMGRWGLILAIIGFVFSALLAINSHTAFIGAAWIASVLAALTPALQVVGAILVFIQGAVTPK